MNNWDEVKNKIHNLEKDPFMSQDMLRTLDTISIADYWRRRFEEEHALGERRAAAKDEELGQLKARLEKQGMELQLAQSQLSAAKTQLEDRDRYWQEKHRFLELESRGLRDRMDWEIRTRVLEEQNRFLQERVPRKQSEADEDAASRKKILELETSKTQLERETQELRAKNVILMEEKAKWEQERPPLRDAAAEAEKLRKAKGVLEAQMQVLESTMSELRRQEKQSAEKFAPLADKYEKISKRLEQSEKEHLLLMEDIGRGFAHRVRNFLGIMSGTLQLCLSTHKMNDDLQKQIGVAEQNSQEILKAIEEFLSMVRIPPMTMETFDLNEFMSRSIAAKEETVQAANVNVHWKKSEVPAMVSADAKLLDEAVSAALSNALEAMPEGGKLTVETDVLPAGGVVRLILQDSGVGVNGNHLRKIFQPYFTTKKGHKGLGLSVLRRIMELHHGGVELASFPGEGTKAILTFPLAEQRP